MANSGGKKYNRGSLTDAVKGMFVAGTDFRTENNSLKPVFAPLGYQRGKMVKGQNVGGYYDVRRMRLKDDFNGSGKRVVRARNGGTYIATKGSFGASFGQSKVVELKSLKEVALQLNAAAYYVDVAMDQWKNVLTQRALQIFRESFSLKHFNSNNGGRRWAGLMQSTIAKRKRMGLWPGAGRILEATGALKDSLIQQKTTNGYMITEKPVTDTYGRTRVYAGIHNDPRFFGANKYPNGTSYQKRKFMGHSAKIDEFIQTYQSRYLFDNVFRIPV